MKTNKTPKVSGLRYALAKKGVSRSEAKDMLRAADQEKLAQMKTRRGEYVERPTGKTVEDFKAFQEERLNKRKPAKLTINEIGVDISLPTKYRSKAARAQERKDIKVVRRGTASNATEAEKFMAQAAIDRNKEGNTRRTFNDLVSYNQKMRTKYNTRMKR
jgi:hypothetical protein